MQSQIAAGTTEVARIEEQMLVNMMEADEIAATRKKTEAALKSEEVWLTIMWRARGGQWKKAGLPVAQAIPKEGVTPTVFEAAIPRNAPNKDCAYAYLDAMLDPEGQVGFAAKMGYVPTVTNAKLDPKLAEDLSFTPEEQKKFTMSFRIQVKPPAPTVVVPQL